MENGKYLAKGGRGGGEKVMNRMGIEEEKIGRKEGRKGMVWEKSFTSYICS